LLLDIPTLFLSREHGAIFATFSGGTGIAAQPASIGRVDLSYVLRGATTAETAFIELRVDPAGSGGPGIVRGEVLVNEFEGLLAASRALYERGSITEARSRIEAVIGFIRTRPAFAARTESAMLEKAAAFLAAAESSPRLNLRDLVSGPSESTFCGIWRIENPSGETGTAARYLVLRPDGRAALIDSPSDRRPLVFNWDGFRVFNGYRPEATLAVAGDRLEYRPVDGERSRAPLKLVRCDPRAAWN